MVLFLLHFIACAFMTGLIWEVQRVHYPMFMALKALPLSDFQRWMEYHTSHISVIVAPVMLFEAFSSVLLLMNPPKNLPGWLTTTNIILVGIIFIETALLSVPSHHVLREKGFDETTISNLVNSNWIRTIAWSVRLLLLSSYLISNPYWDSLENYKQ